MIEASVPDVERLILQTWSLLALMASASCCTLKTNQTGKATRKQNHPNPQKTNTPHIINTSTTRAKSAIACPPKQKKNWTAHLIAHHTLFLRPSRDQRRDAFPSTHRHVLSGSYRILQALLLVVRPIVCGAAGDDLGSLIGFSTVIAH